MQQAESIPDFLYHYTNIDSLAMIMKHKTIRLNSLEKMDDLQEQMSIDQQNFGKFVFVSSWTSDDEESIPMWRMYTPRGRGVRITMPTNPFKEYPATADALAKCLNNTCSEKDKEKEAFKTVIPFVNIISGEFLLTNFAVNRQLFKVNYTDDPSLLKPQVLKIADGQFKVALSDIGTYKNQYWTFQKEWRYRLMFLPMSTQKLMREQLNGEKDEMIKLQRRLINGQASLSFDHYDLTIRDDIFSKSVITLAPDISDSSREFVELLVSKYGSGCTIRKSVLTDLLR